MERRARDAERPVTLFLAGDVMTGRGIDQILPHPTEPHLHEPYVGDAREYVDLAERASGPIPRAVGFTYPWGVALDELERARPDARIVNLETSVTRSDDHWPGKGIHYRMSPENVRALTAARIDVAALANNHVLDYGYLGLLDTIETLARAGIRTAGAGRHLAEARRPAIVDLGAGRLVVFAFGTDASGVAPDWAAGEHRPGVDRLPDFSDATADAVEERVRAVKRPGDVVIASIHWGGNWGYDVPREHRRFAHRLVDGGVDLVHGHSSHHPRPIEVYRDHLVLYGCGDLINDYEGIEGYEAYRQQLGVLYFAEVHPATGALLALRLVPTELRKLRLEHPSPASARWLGELIDRISEPFGCRVEPGAESELVLRPRAA